MTNLSERIARNVRAEMIRRDVNQTDLAAVIGITQSQLSKRLRGTITLDVNEVELIAKHLGVTVSDLAGESQAAGA